MSVFEPTEGQSRPSNLSMQRAVMCVGVLRFVMNLTVLLVKVFSTQKFM